MAEASPPAPLCASASAPTPDPAPDPAPASAPVASAIAPIAPSAPAAPAEASKLKLVGALASAVPLELLAPPPRVDAAARGEQRDSDDHYQESDGGDDDDDGDGDGDGAAAADASGRGGAAPAETASPQEQGESPALKFKGASETHACVSRFCACAALSQAHEQALRLAAARGCEGTCSAVGEEGEEGEEPRAMGNMALAASTPGAATPAPVPGAAPCSSSAAAWAVAARAQAEVQRLRQLLIDRDEQLLRLQREVHKLKSVLQQATSFAPPPPPPPAQPASPAPPPKRPPPSASPPAQPGKRQGVSGESCDSAAGPDDIHVQRYEKDFRSKQLIKEALMDNDFLKNLDGSQVREMVDSMFPQHFERGAFVIREGDAGSHLFVSAEGELEVLRGGRSLGRLSPGRAFGELAILYNCTRTASVVAVTDALVWALDRRVFQRVMLRQGLRRLRDNFNFLCSVPLLRGLAPPLLHRLADALQVEFFPAGAFVVRQGAPGDTFFIISGGSVRVTRHVPGARHEEELRTLTRGDYFGEKALLREETRTASVQALAPGVELLALDRESFTLLIGDLSELRERDYGDAPSPSPSPSPSPAHATRASVTTTSSNGAPPAPVPTPVPTPVPATNHGVTSILLPATAPLSVDEQLEDKELSLVQLDDLDVVATLGVGGFGRVELVQLAYGGRTFALKCLKKQRIVETQQQEHVYNEKNIMLSCRSPFICRLYRTFRDAKCVYLLLEACLGGEVWSVLRDRGRFDDATARFVTGCVVEALDYLHARGVVYRDLKPENLLLDRRGYVKLVDFGFAKCLGPSTKTWTFCGTPEYVAPEVILNKGHDRNVDFWALGVLVFELLTGAPPFSASDPMQTYNLILRGVEAVAFPRHVGRAAQALVRRLCREAPAERLGAGREGIHDVRKHRWFQGFDWAGLQRQTLTPPFAPQIMGPTDTSNFDSYARDDDVPPDEFSNWDTDF